MSTIFLSPSQQKYNPYITGSGSEKYYMNLIADAMVPYLLINGISYNRSKDGSTVEEAIRDSNASRPTIHVALHSNAAPESIQGKLFGPEIYYYKDSKEGQKAAIDIGKQLAKVYPYSKETILIPINDELAELVRTKSPAVYLEIGYHDNEQDAKWIEDHVEQIAEAIVHGITDYFGQPFVNKDAVQIGTVKIKNGVLNVRSTPSRNGKIIGSLKKDEIVLVLRTLPEWLFVLANNISGYVKKEFISLQ